MSLSHTGNHVCMRYWRLPMMSMGDGGHHRTVDGVGVVASFGSVVRFVCMCDASMRQSLYLKWQGKASVPQVHPAVPCGGRRRGPVVGLSAEGE